MIDTKQKRQRAHDFGLGILSYPFPDGEINSTDRAHIMGSYYGGLLPFTEFYKDDMTGEAMALMIEQFKPATKLKGIISSIVNQFQDLELVANQLFLFRDVADATGVNLDNIGSVIGEARLGRSDEVYREAITVKIFLNTGHGEPETLMLALKAFTNATLIRIWDLYPASIQMFSDGVSVPDDIASSMQVLCPAGVDLEVVCSIAPVDTVFTFDKDDLSGDTTGEGLGFNEHNYTVGGIEVGGFLAELFS